MKKMVWTTLAFWVATFNLCLAEGYTTPKEGWYRFNPCLADKPGGVHLGKILGNLQESPMTYLRASGENFESLGKPGLPVRLWGINFTSKAPEPVTLDFIKENKTVPFLPAADAERVADLLAANGMNVVRLHHISLRLIAMQKIIDSPSATAEEKKASLEAWNRFDYFVVALKKRGIRVNFNFLTDGWNVPADSGAPALPKVHAGTRVVYLFHPALIKLQKDRISAFMNRVNPHTGIAYKEDPVLSVVELINETSFYGSGETGEKSDLPEEYAKELDRQFVVWLKKTYQSTTVLANECEELEAGEIIY